MTTFGPMSRGGRSTDKEETGGQLGRGRGGGRLYTSQEVLLG